MGPRARPQRKRHQADRRGHHDRPGRSHDWLTVQAREQTPRQPVQSPVAHLADTQQELLAAPAREQVLLADHLTDAPHHFDQHLVAHAVAVAVVDALEVVDVEQRQHRAGHLGDLVDVLLHVSAVERTGQRVAAALLVELLVGATQFGLVPFLADDQRVVGADDVAEFVVATAGFDAHPLDAIGRPRDRPVQAVEPPTDQQPKPEPGRQQRDDKGRRHDARQHQRAAAGLLVHPRGAVADEERGGLVLADGQVNRGGRLLRGATDHHRVGRAPHLRRIAQFGAQHRHLAGERTHQVVGQPGLPDGVVAGQGQSDAPGLGADTGGQVVGVVARFEVTRHADARRRQHHERRHQQQQELPEQGQAHRSVRRIHALTGAAPCPCPSAPSAALGWPPRCGTRCGRCRGRRCRNPFRSACPRCPGIRSTARSANRRS